MGRALLVLSTDAIRRKACEWIRKAPDGTRVEFKASKRTLPQNDRMWACLTDIAQQCEHMGRKYDANVWKHIFMDAALGRKTNYVPSLNGESVVPLGYHSSDLSKEEMSDLMEFISAWCAENDVTLHDGATAEAASVA